MDEREWSWDEIQAASANTRRSATVPLDTASVAEAKLLAERYERLNGEDRTGLADHAEEMAQLKDRIRELLAQAEAKQLTVVFQGLGKSAYNKLRSEHPAPADQLDEELYGKNPGFDVLTFPPAMLAAACISPPALAGNVQRWTHIHDTWNSGPVARLWEMCIAAQQSVNSVPKLSAVFAALGESSSSGS